MLKKIVIGLLATLLIVILYFQIFPLGGGSKIAFVDNQKVYDSFQMSIELNKNLESYNLKAKSILDSLDFELTQRAGKVNPNDTSQIAEYLAFKKYCTGQYEYFTNNSNELGTTYNQQILTQMNTYIQLYGKDKGYTIILGANGQGSLLYAEEGIDITEDIITYINNKYAGK